MQELRHLKERGRDRGGIQEKIKERNLEEVWGEGGTKGGGGKLKSGKPINFMWKSGSLEQEHPLKDTAKLFNKVLA